MKIFSIVSLSIFSSAYAQTGLTVQTAEGFVSGVLVSQSVRQFLGIPYAQAARWEPPQGAAARSATLEATQFGDSCIQQLSGGNKEFLTLVGLGDQAVSVSENCLSLNIWAPSTNRKQGTSVLIWIYGGGFEFGTVRFLNNPLIKWFYFISHY